MRRTRIPGVTVRQRGNAWQAQVRAGRDLRSGRWIYRCATCDTEAEAWAAGRRLLAAAEAQQAAHVAPTRQTLGAYLEEWLTRKAAENRKARTLHDYQRLIDKVIAPPLGRTMLQDLSPAAIQRWQDGLAATQDAAGASQAAHAHRVLRSALSDAVRLGLLPSNPAMRARPAQRSTRKRPGFTLQEAQALLDSAEGERIAPLIAVILYAGLRHGEALGLRWADVNMEDSTISVRANRVPVGGQMVEGTPKNARSARTIALLSGASEALRRQRSAQAQDRLAAGTSWHPDEWVFTTRDGHPLSESNVDRAFRRIRERAGVRPLPLYSLRHATASILLGAGVPVAVAAKMLGHSVDVFCETYADLLVEATKGAAKMADEWLVGRLHGSPTSRGDGNPPSRASSSALKADDHA